jgi:hypothetical protein
MFNNNNSKRHTKVQEGIFVPVKVKAIYQGEKFCEVLGMERKVKQSIKRLNKEQYEVLSTGDIREYKKNPLKQKDSLVKTFNKLRGLIRCNFDEKSENQLFITLTYAENMQDEKKLYTDYEQFYKRLKRKHKECDFEYITVAEPQGRGAWHLHLMLKATNKEVLYIDNKELTELWRKGMTDVERLKSDDVGTYYVAYFTDVIGQAPTDSKKSKKGSRLSYYPKDFKFYRCSRGIKRPVVEKDVRLDKIEDEYGEPKYSKSVDVVKIENNGIERKEKVINRLYKATFKKDKEVDFDVHD